MTEHKYKLVPVEPTEEMKAAILLKYGYYLPQILDAWALMLAAAPEVNPWVSVKDRLPKTDGFYMCAHKPDCYGNSLLVGRSFSRYFTYDVTHWWDESIMPMPRPKV